MNTFVGVFTQPDSDSPWVFFGAFANYPDADTAVETFLATNKGWVREEFSIQELPFGVLL